MTFLKRIYHGYYRYYKLRSIYWKQPVRLPLVFHPDPNLQTSSENVEEITKEIQRLLDNMVYTMYQLKGIGLSAVQVGVMKKIAVIDTNPTKNKKEVVDNRQPLFLINPEIVYRSEDKITQREVCLSCPNYVTSVKRSKVVKIKYLDYNGKQMELESTDEMLSRVIQHEVDHINGVVQFAHVKGFPM